MPDYGNLTGAELIALERTRQIREGYDADHDDLECVNFRLPRAAICYIWHYIRPDTKSFLVTWPFPMSMWKPDQENRLKQLIKAGALIAAEIDRYQRMIDK